MCSIFYFILLSQFVDCRSYLRCSYAPFLSLSLSLFLFLFRTVSKRIKNHFQMRKIDWLPAIFVNGHLNQCKKAFTFISFGKSIFIFIFSHFEAHFSVFIFIAVCFQPSNDKISLNLRMKEKEKKNTKRETSLLSLLLLIQTFFLFISLPPIRRKQWLIQKFYYTKFNEIEIAMGLLNSRWWIHCTRVSVALFSS